MLNPTEEIKSKIDIVDFLRGYLTLVPAGKNFKALCPFHKEKTPSFMISQDRQSWHCFGSCGVGGDIFAFLMRYENIEFFEALKILAEKAGIELRRVDPNEQRQFGILYDINNTAKNFFISELSKSLPASEYVKKRNLKPETIKEFEIGYAPYKSDALTLELINKGFRVEDIERSGLVFKSDRGGFVDRFRGRIMFPIANHFGKTAAFTGRILPELDNGTMGKYVNSPETAIFKKSKILYGFYKTKNDIREIKGAILVEGQMDFLAVYQDGVKNIVATSGTALTPDHLTVLAKYTEKVVLSFDGDEAGLEAAERAIDLVASFDLGVKVLLLPAPYKDPAELIEKEPGSFVKLVRGARPAMEFYFDKFLRDGMDKKNLRSVLLKIKKMPSALDRSLWIKALSARSGFSEKDLSEEMEGLAIKDMEKKIPEKESNLSSGMPFKPSTRRDMIAENLITLAIAGNNYAEVESNLDLFPAIYREAVAVIKSHGTAPNPKIAGLVNSLTLKSGLGVDYAEADLLKELKRECLKEKQQEVYRSIKLAESKGDGGELSKLMREFDFLSRELHN